MKTSSGVIPAPPLVPNPNPCHVLRGYSSLGRLAGRLGLAFGTAKTINISRFHRPWDDGTAENPQGPPIPVPSSLIPATFDAVSLNLNRFPGSIFFNFLFSIFNFSFPRANPVRPPLTLPRSTWFLSNPYPLSPPRPSWTQPIFRRNSCENRAQMSRNHDPCTHAHLRLITVNYA